MPPLIHFLKHEFVLNLKKTLNILLHSWFFLYDSIKNLQHLGQCSVS